MGEESDKSLNIFFSLSWENTKGVKRRGPTQVLVLGIFLHLLQVITLLRW